MVLKKHIVLLVLATLSIGLFAEDSITVKGYHPYKVEQNEKVADEIAHWSLIPHIGFNAFDGDFNSEMKHNVAIPCVGLGLEYAFTPVWSLGIEYKYDMYTVTGDTSIPQNADTLLCGDMHKAGAYLAADLINLFFPRARKKILSVHAMVGGGAGFYQSRKYYMDDAERDPTHKRGQTSSYINADGVNGPDHMDGYKCLPYVQVGLNTEFNLNRSLALGIRADYSYFTKDVIDGRGFSGEAAHASKNNDGLFNISLMLRYKINAVKKNHPRNYTTAFEIEQIANRNRKNDTVFMITHDTVIMKEREVASSKEANYHQSSVVGRNYYIYFDNAKSELTEQGLNITQQIADIMLNDTSIYIDVVGLCDNTGSVEFNNKLAQARADRVIDELREEYGIPADHFITLGRGKVVGRRSRATYGPNRRVEVKMISRERFEQLKEARKNKAQVSGGVSTRESVNRITLSSVARRHYGNNNCWVYLYEANRDKITDINSVPDGLQINIPELTEQQRAITASEAMEYFQQLQKK